MKVSVIIAYLTAAGSILATPTALRPGSEPFQILPLRSASPIHFGEVSASRRNFFINSKVHDAVCQGSGPTPRATFYIKDTILYLYTPKKLIQKAFVDRSGFGQGKLGYLTGDGPLPPRFEDKGWKVVGNDLTFRGQVLIGCPSPDGSYNIWVATNNPNPGGNHGCLGFTSRVIPSPKSVRCRYS